MMHLLVCLEKLDDETLLSSKPIVRATAQIIPLVKYHNCQTALPNEPPFDVSQKSSLAPVSWGRARGFRYAAELLTALLELFLGQGSRSQKRAGTL